MNHWQMDKWKTLAKEWINDPSQNTDARVFKMVSAVYAVLSLIESIEDLETSLLMMRKSIVETHGDAHFSVEMIDKALDLRREFPIDLQDEFRAWEQASDEDFEKFEDSI